MNFEITKERNYDLQKCEDGNFHDYDVNPDIGYVCKKCLLIVKVTIFYDNIKKSK